MYIPHSSDSLILKIADYYSKDKKSPEYLESIYYCGRVYDDLGDYPTAMKYYQEAIDITSNLNNKDEIVLRGNALSCLIHLLDQLHLFEESINYLKKLIYIDEVMGDTINLVHDYRTIGYDYFQLGKVREAEKWFIKGRELAEVHPNLEAMCNVYLAGIKRKQGEYKTALNILRTNLEKVDSNIANVALTYMTYLYDDLGKYDSAYIFAKKLISCRDVNNKKNGYAILLSPNLEKEINIDTARMYITDYRELLNEELKHNEEQTAILQNTRYNYSLHERGRAKAEEDRERLFTWLGSSIILILIIALLYLIQVLHGKRQMIMLYKAYALISELEIKINKDNINEMLLLEVTEGDRDENVIEYSDERDRLRRNLFNKAEELVQSEKDTYSVPSIISDSPSYVKLRHAITKGISIENDLDLWHELEAEVVKVSKDFEKRLAILLGGRVKDQEMRMALLVKCGVTPSEMTKLLNKEKGTISYRRAALGQKAFGKKMNTKMVDKLIRLL
ncbi:MAG: hypothetical protein K2H96_01925 [Muribaculaceae bacterium]|nr:hypothetical protein [Muribaculaceae bacterium]